MGESGVHAGYSSIGDMDLDMLVRAYKIRKPNLGFRYVCGYLRSVGIRVQKRRVLGSLKRVDRIGRFIRRHTIIRRRKYFSSRPNALWHCDGHHKLIKYGFVIHGFIDGNCRTVCRIPCLCSCLGSHSVRCPRLQPFVQTQTIMQAQFWSSSFLPSIRTVTHPVFVEIAEGKMSSSLHT